MRRFAVIVALLISTAAFAQDKPNGVYVFLSNPGGGSSDHSGSYWEGAFGVALQRMFTPHLSGEVTISRERHHAAFSIFGESGSSYTNTTPVDLTARYHFLDDGSWKPYAGLGARWVDGRAMADVTGGVVWQFRPSLGLRFDAKLLLGNNAFNDTFNGAVGLAWRF